MAKSQRHPARVAGPRAPDSSGTRAIPPRNAQRSMAPAPRIEQANGHPTPKGNRVAGHFGTESPRDCSLAVSARLLRPARLALVSRLRLVIVEVVVFVLVVLAG
jgi:hypothetical protein